MSNVLFYFRFFTICNRILIQDLAWGKVGIISILCIYVFCCLFRVIFFAHIYCTFQRRWAVPQSAILLLLLFVELSESAYCCVEQQQRQTSQLCPYVRESISICGTSGCSILAPGLSHSSSPDWLLVSLWIWCLINIHHSALYTTWLSRVLACSLIWYLNARWILLRQWVPYFFYVISG